MTNRRELGAAIGGCAAALLAAALVVPALAQREAQDWPQWRGPTRDSIIRPAQPWPADLSGLERVWRVELGPGYGGPIVSGGRVFVTETRDRRDEVVRALDRSSGAELWRASWPGAMSVPFFAKRNGDWIRATPACDGESLYVAGMRDVLACLDVRDGAVRWRVDFPERLGTPVPAFGFVCSPLVVDEHVYTQAGAAFVKLDRRSGEVVWRALIDRGGMDSAFSSPIMTTLHGVPQILVQTREKLAGVRPETGEVLWSQVVPAFRGMNILTPTVYRDGVFTSSYKNRTFFYEVARDEQRFTVREAWSLGAQGYMSSPVIIGDHAYMHLGNGRFCCIDLASGREVWRTSSFGQYWSMVASGDRILALDQRGELLLIAADPAEFRLLDRQKISEEETWAHLAVCGDEVFVRDLAGITAYVWRPAARQQPAPTGADGGQTKAGR